MYIRGGTEGCLGKPKGTWGAMSMFWNTKGDLGCPGDVCEHQGGPEMHYGCLGTPRGNWDALWMFGSTKGDLGNCWKSQDRMGLTAWSAVGIRVDSLPFIS